MQFTRTIFALATLGILGGCASPVLTTNQAGARTSERIADETSRFAEKASPSVRVVEGPAVQFAKKQRAASRGDVNVKAAAAPFGPLLTELAKKTGYTVAFTEAVDASRKITVEFNNSQGEDAIRTTAFMAGYVAVFNKERRTVTVADAATFTFKLPPAVLSNLKASYKAGTDGAGSGGGGGAGGKSGGGASTGISSEFSIEGQEGPNGGALAQLIQTAAGGQASVHVSSLGYVTVRGGAQSLARVTELVKRLSREAMTQVDIEASVVEVNLTREFSYGITWDKVLQRASGSSYSLGTTPADLLGSSSFTLSRTGASTTSIIEALERFTDVRVVSQPRLVSMNNMPSNFIEATQVPYLGSVQQTASTVSGGAPTVSGELSFAIDGVTFSAIPSVIDSNQVQISLLPVIDSVGEFARFDLGGSRLEAPRSGKKQSFMRVLAESGKTLILGGIRVGNDSTTTAAPSSTSGTRGTKEIVILLRANILEPRNFDPIVAEAI